ncbi:uncharacterized protein B0I36DRAFT_164328 [Microdochium trichocladiopsis]|uniref:Zn(2)-C6 fungal-type domain-containing protein n=1 Tax=Microdochium trichocladiopsis TaxID=1682393 RepID=A0A9P8XXT1_9PEZI|nr:uncharacterized protein B0I36DRAFT_164328 [Microdochium trichocladiopsis]KAH7024767.1 hypothetical protein B0I36DRAFT_164328 [Microdochium trichocladiopsis]
MVTLEPVSMRASPPSAAAREHAEWPQAEKKKKRSSAPKARTGCRECKASHVRCNEKQPTCGRCQRRKTACTYLAVQPKQRGGGGRAARTTQVQPAYRKLLPSTDLPPLTRLVEPAATCLSPREIQYFDTFRHSVVFQLGYGYGYNGFWQRTVLREITRDDCVRNAVVAIGALARAQGEHDQVAARDEKEGGRRPGKPRLPLCKAGQLSPSSHYYHALTHYTRAVGSFRRLIDIASRENDSGTRQEGEGEGGGGSGGRGHGSSGGSKRAVLIATILLVAFESLQGNTASADQLSARSLSLLQNSIMQGTLGEAKKGNNSNSSSLLPPSRIARSVDDEGTYETEVLLVRDTFFSSGLSSTFAKAREVVTRIARTTARGPLPPDASEDVVVFSRMWTRCLILSSLWYVRMYHMFAAHQCAFATHTAGGEDTGREEAAAARADTEDAPGSATSAADARSTFRREQAVVIKTLKAWKTATEQRLAIASARVEALKAAAAVADNTTTTASAEELAAAEQEMITYHEIAVAVLGVQLSACTVSDMSERIWDQYELEIADLVTRMESMRSEKKAAMASSSGGWRLRHHCDGFEGPRPVLGHIAQRTRSPDLRRRLMQLWRSGLDSKAHWDVQGNYLGSLAVFEVEEEGRDKETGKIPMEKQYEWVGGKWSDDYSEFAATLMAKVPGENGVPEMKVVVMPALEP